MYVRIAVLLLLMINLFGVSCSGDESAQEGVLDPGRDTQESERDTEDSGKPHEEPGGGGEDPGTDTDADGTDTGTETGDDGGSKDPILGQVERLSLEEKIGQLLLAGIEGTGISEQAKSLIQDYHVGGLILYNKNIESAEQTRSLLNDLKQLNQRNSIPLFLSLDQEGGSVNRLPQQFEPFPSAHRIGQTSDENLSFQIGQITGQAVAALGFNMNYAPVLDINSNPNNPVIGERAFGSDVETVSASGIAMMRGLQSSDIIPVVKHFPGHGDTSVDSHLNLPEVNKSLQQLKEFELIPFADAVEQGADVVMIAHILLSNIDSQHPASLSETMITSLLREEIGFEGVIITDDLTMGGITEHYDIAEAAVQSLKAGSDIVMVAHGFERAAEVFQAVKSAVDQGEISINELDEHVYRVLQLKSKYELSNDPVEEADLEKLNEQIRTVSSQLK